MRVLQTSVSLKEISAIEAAFWDLTRYQASYTSYLPLKS